MRSRGRAGMRWRRSASTSAELRGAALGRWTFPYVFVVCLLFVRVEGVKLGRPWLVWLRLLQPVSRSLSVVMESESRQGFGINLSQLAQFFLYCVVQ